jgi:hypothetical protein
MAACMEALVKEQTTQWTAVLRAPQGGRVGWGPRTAVVASKRCPGGGGEEVLTATVWETKIGK